MKNTNNDLEETDIICPECGEKVFKILHKISHPTNRIYEWRTYWCRNNCDLSCHNCIHSKGWDCNADFCINKCNWTPIKRGEKKMEIKERNEFKEQILKKAEDLAKILIKKNLGYGNSFYDGLDEVKEIIAPFLDEHHLMKYIHYISFYVREKDKFKRFKNLMPANLPDDEKKKQMYDAILDIVGYGLLFLNYLDNESNKYTMQKEGN